MNSNCLKAEDHLPFLTALPKHGVMIVGPLTKLKDKSMSPVYVNMRDDFWNHPDLMEHFANLFVDLIQQIVPADHQGRIIVCGIPQAANPLAAQAQLIAHQRGFDYTLIALRHEPKDHGTDQGSLVMGKYREGDIVFLIDDVITTSKTKREALEKLTNGGFPQECIIVTVAFDRQQGGFQALEKDGWKTAALFRILDVAKELNRDGVINDTDHVAVQQFIGANQYA